MYRLRSLMLSLPLWAGLTTAALAQQGSDLLFDPQQLPSFQGKVAHYSLTPWGGVDGLLLDDGTQIHVSPRLSTQLVAIAKPGDSVVVHGVKASSGSLVLAVSVANAAGGKTLVSEMAERRRGRGPRGGGAIVAQGKIKAVLRNQRDEVDGVVLEDGSQIRIWPREASRLAGQMIPGQTIYASGFGQDTLLGKVVVPRRIGTTEADATDLAPPMMGRPMMGPPMMERAGSPGGMRRGGPPGEGRFRPMGPPPGDGGDRGGPPPGDRGGPPPGRGSDAPPAH